MKDVCLFSFIGMKIKVLKIRESALGMFPVTDKTYFFCPYSYILAKGL